MNYYIIIHQTFHNEEFHFSKTGYSVQQAKSNLICCYKRMKTEYILLALFYKVCIILITLNITRVFCVCVYIELYTR